MADEWHVHLTYAIIFELEHQKRLVACTDKEISQRQIDKKDLCGLSCRVKHKEWNYDQKVGTTAKNRCTAVEENN